MSSLTSTFDECRKQPDGKTLEQMRAHYFTDAIMNEKESPNTGGLNIPHADVLECIKDRKKREEYTKYITRILKSLNTRLDALEAQLARIEDKLIRNHGKYFADELAAEYLDAETNKTLMLIQDDEERRHATANALNDGIENGTVDSVEIYKNTDIKEWLDVSKERENLIESKQDLKGSKVDTVVAHENNVEETHLTKENKSLESGLNSFFS